MTTFRLVRLGIKYERASNAQPKQWDTVIAIEKQLNQLQEQSEDWIAPWIIRGQNMVRQRLNLPLVKT